MGVEHICNSCGLNFGNRKSNLMDHRSKKKQCTPLLHTTHVHKLEEIIVKLEEKFNSQKRTEVKLEEMINSRTNIIESKLRTEVKLEETIIYLKGLIEDMTIDYEKLRDRCDELYENYKEFDYMNRITS